MRSLYSMCLLWPQVLMMIAGVLILCVIQGTIGLKNMAVNIPQAVTPGDTVTLQCQYDLEGESLYTVKWYKGRHEFFRYIPKELPSSRVFPMSGVAVDVSRSGPHQVVLAVVQLSMSGRYRCEVSADAPSFHTSVMDGYMYVVLLPEGQPHIISDKQSYTVGDTLLANCSAPASSPPVNLTWYINDKQISQAFLHRSTVIPPTEDILLYPNLTEFQITNNTFNYIRKDFTTSPTSPPRKNAHVITSGIDVLLDQYSFKDGKLRVRCVASLFHLYKTEAHLLLVDDESPILALVLATRSTNGGASIVPHVIIYIATLTTGIFR